MPLTACAFFHIVFSVLSDKILCLQGIVQKYELNRKWFYLYGAFVSWHV